MSESIRTSGEHPRVPRRALKWAFVMIWGRRGISLLFTFVLAAILGPQAFGIVTLALVYIAVVELFVEQGMVTAIVQRRELDDAHLDSAFWVNLAWSTVFAGVSIALAGFWARANGVPELEPIIDVLSITIVLWALSLVQRAQLQREMQFKKLAVRSNVASLIGGVVGVSLALGGAGVWALVAQQLTYAAVSTLAFAALGRWRPRLRFSLHHARELFGFSIDVLFANLAGFLSRRGDILFMGLFFSPVVVGHLPPRRPSRRHGARDHHAADKRDVATALLATSGRSLEIEQERPCLHETDPSPHRPHDARIGRV